MLTSMRNRRRDVAILRSFGADRGWIARAVLWQATLLTAVPVVIGVPAGSSSDGSCSRRSPTAWAQ